MKKIVILFLFIVISTSCKKITEESVVKNLPGYWEIKKVETPEGETKEYKINTTIDLISLQDDNKGFRKKLQPDLTGKFYGSDDIEEFTILNKENGFWLEYATGLMKWEEKIKEISEDELVLENEKGLIYYYKKFEPISIN